MHPYLAAYAMGTGCLLIPRNCSHSPFTVSLEASQSCANLEPLQVIEHQISQNKVDINSNWDKAVVVIEDKIGAVSHPVFPKLNERSFACPRVNLYDPVCLRLPCACCTWFRELFGASIPSFVVNSTCWYSCGEWVHLFLFASRVPVTRVCFLYRNSARVVACFVKIPTLVMRYFMTSKEWPHFGDGPEWFFPHYTDVLLCPVVESITSYNWASLLW